MNSKKIRKLLSFTCCIALLMVIGKLPPTKSVQAATNDYFTSFEKEDPSLDWESTVETDAEGNKMASGIDGHIPFDGIKGDITDQVVKIDVPGENPPSETKDKLVDRDPTTKWLIFEKTAYIQYELEEADTVVKYALTSANDSPNRDPKDWTFEGSNDGEVWTTLDKRSNQSFDERYERKTYDFENTESYKYYRLNITSNHGESIIQLSELAISNGIEVPTPPASDMKTHISNGPSSAYTSKAKVGWTGLNTVTYAGSHLADERAYSYNKILDVDIDVTPDTVLSYYVFPEFTDPSHTDYGSTYVSVDLAFSDGTYLHDLKVEDQHDIKLDPQSQGDSKTLYANQWNFKKANLGDAAAGKTIERILIAYDNPEGPGTFTGHIDDIKIDGDPDKVTYSKPADYVNTLRGTQSNGTFSRGNNFPAVAVPHGFNFWTPVTNAGSNWIYAYNESNNDDNLPELQAFALSHETSPWMGDRQTFQIMPSDAKDEPSANRNKRALPFKHENETAHAHYYGVTFENGLKTEMTPTDHAAMFRFTFKEDHSNLIFDNVSNKGGITLDADNGILTGYTDQKSGLSTGATRMFVYATFDQPIVDSGKLSGEDRDDVSGYYKFDTSEDKVVTMKIATSLISIDQAKKNLEQEIDSQDTFESIQKSAEKTWNDKLGIIEVEGASDEQLTTLYSNMYRLFLYPNKAFENVGTIENPAFKYASQLSLDTCTTSTPTKTCAPIEDGEMYVNNGFWDTYRTTWPAYALLTPTKAGEMIDGFVQHYRDGGWISRWSSPGYANLMVGTSANVAFADSYLKGVTNFDVESFYQSALKDAAVSPPNDNVGRKGMATSIFDGYTNTSTGEGMSWAMDGYINDFGIAQLAKVLDKQAGEADPYQPNYKQDYHYYLNRAQNYQNMFNPHIDFFNGKTKSGQWRSTPNDFIPEEWRGDYTETNAWNMAFHAPQDGQGLANLYGGKDGLEQKLDTFFSTPEKAAFPGGSIIHEMREARDVRMGMYGHSNQPAHHIAYMYNYVGKPWKTQEKVREVLERLYIGSEIGQGYAGDEDNGEMSAWYIFSALGFYPLKMGSPEYAIGAPLFEKATIHLENGKDIVINAPNNNDKKNKYVQGLKVNNEDYTKNYITHADLIDGATLDFEMGDKPSDWGSNITGLPASIVPESTDGLSTSISRDLTDHAKGKATNNGNNSTNDLFDNTSKTQVDFENDNPWVQYQFTDGKKKVKMYTLTSGNSPISDEPDSQVADPKNWVLKGSNDGDSWQVLDERKNEKFKWRKYTRAFEIEDPQAFSFYKLEVKENGGHQKTSIAEVEFLGIDEQVVGLASGIKGVIEGLVDDGEIENDQAVHALNMHLTAVEHFEKDGKREKVVKHMKGFNQLLARQQETDLISKDAYHTLKTNTDYMIEMWE